MHKLIIHNLGPINDCELTCRQFMTFTGEQASGKSTVAKALYYFRTVKDDVYDALRGISVFTSGYKHPDDKSGKILIKTVREILRKKFLRTFGYQVRELKPGMRIKYYYTKQIFITVRLLTVKNHNEKVSFILNVELSDLLTDFINQLDEQAFSFKDDLDIAKVYQLKLRASLNKIFNDEYETIYIPSGRSMLTLLSDYINPYYMRGSGESTNLSSNLDYCTQLYIDLLFRVKNEFSGGTEARTSPPARSRSHGRKQMILYIKCFAAHIKLKMEKNA